MYQSLATLAAEVVVVRNDALSVEALLRLRPTAIVLSPGPGEPRAAGVMPELLVQAPDALPILGVCLGHQALVERYGGTLERDPIPMHGRSSLVHHDGDLLFADLPDPFEAGRYHSLRAVRTELPSELNVTAWTDDGLVMAVRHASLPRFGVQFHPESILTPRGERIFANFLRLATKSGAARH